MSLDSITYRLAEAADMPAVHSLVMELAIYEKAEDSVYTSPAEYKKDAFESDREWFFCYVAEHPQDGIVGIALSYFAYSTWRGKMVYLDDLVITESYRRKGIGGQLVELVIRHAKDAGANMIKWQVIDWNEPAIRMYEKLGVTFDGEWIDCKLYFEQ